jgi:hypothetical protein
MCCVIKKVMCCVCVLVFKSLYISSRPLVQWKPCQTEFVYIQMAQCTSTFQQRIWFHVVLLVGLAAMGDSLVQLGVIG